MAGVVGDLTSLNGRSGEPGFDPLMASAIRCEQIPELAERTSMSPSFNPAERRRITAQLRATATELFTTRGVRKTSLEDLTAAAGISKSSFYSFFASKEALFLDLMMEEMGVIGPRLAAAASASEARDQLAGLFRAIVTILDDHPLYRRLLTHPEELKAVRDRLGEEDMERVQRELIAPLTDFVTRAQQEGRIAEADPAAVVGLFQAVSVVHVNAGEFDPAAYPAVLDLLIDTVVTGLTTDPTGGVTRR
ncbi:TetR/AcrR family transcriptional regulator [Pseudonocardia humida]|uniref:TetR/AcrR family transcriptional regulator n=1 Tax=Pseudonocardia humida TaxID=2800819 RepID=A0ABT1ADR0_9PSEU|nr:TetR/AcrR family transcriptional regulator [Pseudonocardia humida]MCO1660821.1 TetR/AcrR family transcriptional regulator [Pseudonocardia humida]MCO1661041.1 TetR/AcrR family transcriptional regulator [Pseudonocardia humida]